jgi:tetratricopeptide (TPR) repeat protein
MTFARAQARQGQVVLLHGEAGIGKSRLMQEFAARVQDQAIVLVSSCFAGTHSIPYQPIVEALRPAVNALALLRTVPVTWLSEASLLLPELRHLSPGLPPPALNTDLQQARSRLFEALARLVLGLTQDNATPVLLCVDDLHWADATTLEWLAYVARQARRHAFMLVGTVREEEADALTALMSDLSRAGFRAERHIAGLSSAPIRQLLAHLHVDDETMSRRLQDLTGGNPFFLIETLNEVLERGTPGAGLTVGDDLPISATVRETLQRRLERLAPLSRQVLEAGAVQETAFDFDFVRSVAGRSELETADAVDDLVNRALLVAEGDRLRFRHELIRVAVYQELSAWRRRVLHQRVAQEMETEHANATEGVAVQLAHHFALAGRLDKAVFYWQQAGDAAARLYAQAEAVDAYRHALQMAQTGNFHEQLQPLFLSLGRALELNSHFDQALANYEAMEAFAAELGIRSQTLHALIAQAVLYTTYNPKHDLMRGEALCRRALEIAKELQDEAAEAKILGNLIILYSYAHRWEEAIAAGTRSIALARRHNLRDLLATSLNDLGSHCYSVLGRHDLSFEVLDEANALWRELGNLSMLADNLATIAETATWSGDYRRALHNGREALQINQSIDNAWGQSYSLYRTGWVYWERGRVDAALLQLSEAERLAELSGFGVPQVLARSDLAMLYAELGDVERGAAVAQRAITFAETKGEMLLPYALGALAQIQIQRHHLDEVATLLGRAEAHLAEYSELVYHAPAFQARVLLALRRQAYAQACKDAQRLAGHSVAANRPLALLLEAQAHLALGARDLAYTRLQAARQAAATSGSRRILWRALHMLSDMERDATRAAQLRRHAICLVRTIAGYIPDPNLRTTFLHTPDVRRLLDA